LNRRFDANDFALFRVSSRDLRFLIRRSPASRTLKQEGKRESREETQKGANECIPVGEDIHA